MGVERFFQSGAAKDLILAGEIKRRHDYFKGAGRSKFLVTSIGLCLFEEAASDLREVASYSTKHALYGPLFPDSQAFNGLPTPIQDKFLKAYAVFYTAPALRGIELAITEKRVTFEDLTAVIRGLTAGTKLEDIKTPKKELNPFIEEDQYIRMLKLREQDPSHMIYFKEGYGAMPEAIRYLLDQTESLIWIGNLVVSPFRRLHSEIDFPLREQKPQLRLPREDPLSKLQVDEVIANLASQMPK